MISKICIYIFIFVLISGPNAKQNAYTWNIPSLQKGNYSDIIGHRTSIQLKIEKKNNRRQTTNYSIFLAPHGWLVLSFLQQKNSCHLLQLAPTRKPPRRACQRILPLPRRSLNLRRQRPGLTYQSPKVGPNHYRHPPTPRWDQDECGKRNQSV